MNLAKILHDVHEIHHSAYVRHNLHGKTVQATVMMQIFSVQDYYLDGSLAINNKQRNIYM